MPQTLQNRPLPMPENSSEYSFSPEIAVEGAVSPGQLSRSIAFNPEDLRWLVQDAAKETLSDLSRAVAPIGTPHESEVTITRTPKSVAAEASRVALETMSLRNREIKHEMRSQN